ncbi:hypothetical protein E2C01_086913 [Portunus trituberculatus]|uniref:Uncharacterized protein n=1 Tax=Portunus trituberculatus TaxID=210409 RepID=A0A5B7J6L8_PORTR|nr:hypothetical protein [Portunus trituberculatus]
MSLRSLREPPIQPVYSSRKVPPSITAHKTHRHAQILAPSLATSALNVRPKPHTSLVLATFTSFTLLRSDRRFSSEVLRPNQAREMQLDGP